MSEGLRPDRTYYPEEFWDARPILKAIKWWASDRVKSPYAILVWVMVQMLSRIPYNTFYVTKTGANSLNMTFNISGDTGTGKSASRHLASDPEKICKFLGNYWFAAPLVQPRSGEAIGDSYFIRAKKTSDDGKDFWEDEWVNLNRSVIFFFDEVLFLIGKQRQNSSTLPSVLLSMWSGEMLGGALTGGKGKTVQSKEYRACTVIHSQKENDPYRSDSSGYSGETSRVLNVRLQGKCLLVWWTFQSLVAKVTVCRLSSTHYPRWRLRKRSRTYSPVRACTTRLAHTRFSNGQKFPAYWPHLKVALL
jgi:hypothetical protein